MSGYYTPSGVPATRSKPSSAAVRGEFALIAAAFDKLPSLPGTARKFLRISDDGTTVVQSSALEQTTTGVGVTGTLEVSGAVTAASMSVSGAVTAPGGVSAPAGNGLFGGSVTGNVFSNNSVVGYVISNNTPSVAFSIPTGTGIRKYTIIVSVGDGANNRNAWMEVLCCNGNCQSGGGVNNLQCQLSLSGRDVVITQTTGAAAAFTGKVFCIG